MLLHDLILDRIDSHGDQLALIRGDESISYAEPENISDLENVDYEDIVYPFKK